MKDYRAIHHDVPRVNEKGERGRKEINKSLIRLLVKGSLHVLGVAADLFTGALCQTDRQERLPSRRSSAQTITKPVGVQ